MEQGDLIKLLDLAEEHAKVVMLWLHEPLMPSWVLISNKGKVDILPTPWRDELEKQIGKHYLRAQMSERDTIAYSVVLEAWTASATQEEIDSGQCVPASQRADKREIVLAMATDGVITRWRTWDIIRDFNEQVTALPASQTDLNQSQIETWMTKLLRK